LTCTVPCTKFFNDADHISDIVAMMTRPRGQAAETCPPHRIPTAEQIQNMMTAERNRTRLHVNPCRATNFMVNNNPHDMY
jgi:hypothetical protein